MNILSYFRRAYRRIKRFLVWIPVLWKDEDWDYAYLFEILRFKVSRMRQEIEKNKRHVGYGKNVRDMKVAEALLGRMGFSDFYWHLSQQLENEEKKEHCRCPKETWEFEPEAIDSKTRETTSRMIDLSCTYCQKNRNRWHKREQAKEKADLDYLFIHLRKKIHEWWD